MDYLNGWTQETVTEHLKKHFKGKSENITDDDYKNECKYRFDGKKCVAGCFIPDDKYHSNFEGLAIDDVIEDNDLHGIMPLHVDTMEKWQRVHDELSTYLTTDKQLEILTDFLL